jgi:hypothetical protein
MRLRHVARLALVVSRARLRATWHHGLRHDDWNIGSSTPRRVVPRERSFPTSPGAAGARPKAGGPVRAPGGAALQVYYEDFAHASGTASIARRRWSREKG